MIIKSLFLFPCSNFSEAVLDIFNCETVFLDFISLYDNTGTAKLQEPLRGNGGGVAIGYNMLPLEYTQVSLTLSNSEFLRNEANGFLTPEAAVATQVYRGRGGGVAVFMNESQADIHINISDCVFESNIANIYGGGLYMISTSYTTSQHTIRIERCRFTKNRARLFGSGGLSVSFLNAGDKGCPHTAVLSDCSFEGNSGAAGGAFYGFIGKSH